MIDFIYRYFLSPQALREKRRLDQEYQIASAVKSSLNVNTCSEVDQNGMQSLIDNIMKDDFKTPSIIGIECVKEGEGEGDCNLLLDVDGTVTSVPLEQFGIQLAEAFEQKLTSHAMCFVADASSGLGTKIIGNIAASCGAGMALIQEPVWMLALAYAIEQKKMKPSQTSKIVFALARLDAWRVRKDVGESRTVVFTLPGQACTANLLPSLQEVFPCERHIFIYDGCIDSVSRGLGLGSGMGLGWNSKNKADCIPIAQVMDLKGYDSLLKKLAWNRAYLVEAWMSSVSAFLKLKHTEKKSGYIPFVCRLGFLMKQVGKLGNGTEDQSHLALSNLLQYMTGSKSRKIKDEVYDAANKILEMDREVEIEKMKSDLLTDFEKEVIEECAFAHKGILIENKTLMDTVQPRVEWSLKAARKLTSCACCMPGEGDEDSDEDEDGERETGTKLVAKATFTSAPNSAYVDGKSMFAFDPTKFNL